MQVTGCGTILWRLQRVLRTAATATLLRIGRQSRWAALWLRL